jgi:hypothetical protein
VTALISRTGIADYDTASLAELEAIIDRFFRSWVETGHALAEIRRRRLYRGQGYASFDAYLVRRWGFTRQRAAQLIEGARIVAHLSTTVDKLPELSERATRELAPLANDPEAMTRAFRRAQERAAGRPVTAPLLRKSVEAERGSGKLVALRAPRSASVRLHLERLLEEVGWLETADDEEPGVIRMALADAVADRRPTGEGSLLAWFVEQLAAAGITADESAGASSGPVVLDDGETF